MPFTHEQETAFIGAQLGIETTWGSDAAATIKLGAVDISPSPKRQSNRFKPKGILLPAVDSIGREWSEFSFNGIATYQELPYFIKDIVSDAQSDPVSYTVESGGLQYLGCVVTAWDVEGDRDEIRLSGSMVGKKGAAASATGGLTVPTQFVFPAGSTTIKVGTAGAETTYSKCFSWKLGVSGLWSPAFFIGSAEPANVVQSAIEGNFSFKVEADSNGMVPYGLTGEQSVIIKCETGTTPNKYTLQFTFNVVLEEPEGFSDEDGVYAIGYKGSIMNKSTTAVDVTCTKS